MIKYVLFIIIISSIALANDVAKGMTSFFNDINMLSNTTKPGAFEDQTGGYYTGGSLYARLPAKNMQLATIEMPSFKAGCGGIDLFTGGFSFINSQALVNMMKNIGSNSISYAFALGLQTMTPQIYNVMHELHSIAQNVNNANINSCESAAAVVGGMWPKTDASSRLLCSSMGSSNNRFSDWAAARQGCGAKGERDSVNNGRMPGFRDILGDEFNLSWKAIKKNAFLASDDELAEIYMSISGSIISKRNGSGGDASFSKSHLQSLLQSQELIDALLHGNKSAVIYACDDRDENKCLNPSTKTMQVSSDKALVQRVDKLLRSMSDKVMNGEGDITAEERGLVGSTKLPIFKIIAVQSAFKADGSHIGISEFSEAIAYDALLQYLEQVLDTVAISLNHLRKVQIDDAVIAEFRNDISKARKRILDMRNGIFQQLNTTLSLIERSRQIEQQLQSMFISVSQREEE